VDDPPDRPPDHVRQRERAHTEGSPAAPQSGLGPLSPVGLHAGAAAGDDARSLFESTLRCALNRGVDWVLSDAADGFGTAQQLLGCALARLQPFERPFVIARVGKVWDLSRAGSTPHRILLPEVLRRSVEASLERLQIESVDALVLDGPDEMGVPLETSWEALVELRDAGLAGAAGVTCYPLDAVNRCSAIAPVDLVGLDLPGGRHLLPPLAAWSRDSGRPLVSALGGRVVMEEADRSRAAAARPSQGLGGHSREERLVSDLLSVGSTSIAVEATTPRQLIPWLQGVDKKRDRVA
jgi:hypothetical protein